MIPKENALKDCSPSELLNLTTEIVSAHVSNNEVEADDLPKLIQQVHKTLIELGSGAVNQLSTPVPVVAIEESVQDEYIVCLEDGRKLKMLKRHLKSAYNMTPEDYRERWNLPSTYPMVAPNYAKRRSNLARKIGLGRQRKRAA